MDRTIIALALILCAVQLSSALTPTYRAGCCPRQFVLTGSMCCCDHGKDKVEEARNLVQAKKDLKYARDEALDEADKGEKQLDEIEELLSKTPEEESLEEEKISGITPNEENSPTQEVSNSESCPGSSGEIEEVEGERVVGESKE